MVADFFMGCVSGGVLRRETCPAELENSCRSFCIFCTKNKKTSGEIPENVLRLLDWLGVAFISCLDKDW